MVYRGYQLVMGLNVKDKANCAANGFQCAEDPPDWLSYSPNMEQSEYCLVNAGGGVDEDNRDSKISCTGLTILNALAYMMDRLGRKCSGKIMRDAGCAEKSGYILVRGADPIAEEYAQSPASAQTGQLYRPEILGCPHLHKGQRYLGDALPCGVGHVYRYNTLRPA